MDMTFDPPIQIHQCLFGYQDGHRLLSSSEKLTANVVSTLLLLSDLAPGLNLPGNSSYWTGLPIPVGKFYVLMRTWLASEMPRPGCAWTHALLIPFSEIARFEHFGVLTNKAIRPTLTDGYESYSTPLLITSEEIKAYQPNPMPFENALRVIHAIYTEDAAAKLIAPLGTLDDAIFATWSQQWPRLRRSFSFRTAASPNENIATPQTFDLTVLLNPTPSQALLNNENRPMVAQWEQVCLHDMGNAKGTDFRRFLWRYGADIRFGRKRFKFLTELFIATRTTVLAGKDLHSRLSTVTSELVAPEDGRVLKDDLINSSRYSMVSSTDPIDLLEFYVSNHVAAHLPPLPDEVFAAIKEAWLNRSEDILAIAESAASHESDVGNKLLARLAQIMDASNFLSSTTTYPTLRSVFAKSNPWLLNSSDLAFVPAHEILPLIKYVADENTDLIDQLLPILLTVNDLSLASELLQRFPHRTILALITKVESTQQFRALNVQESWRQAIKANPGLILYGGYIENAKTTSMLAFFASMVGYDQAITLRAGPIPWGNGIKNARDDLLGAERVHFLLFLLELALYKPTVGCEPLFELSFETIHIALQHTNLDSNQINHLNQYLPFITWWHNWDYCLRLRIGVGNAYVANGLNQQSFLRLTTNAELQTALYSLVSNTKKGKEYLKLLA